MRKSTRSLSPLLTSLFTVGTWFQREGAAAMGMRGCVCKRDRVSGRQLGWVQLELVSVVLAVAGATAAHGQGSLGQRRHCCPHRGRAGHAVSWRRHGVCEICILATFWEVVWRARWS